MLIWLPILVSILAVAYLVSPIDIIPDVIPGLGITDDFLFVLIALGFWVIYFFEGFVKELAKNPLSLVAVGFLLILGFWLFQPRKKGRRR